MIKPILHASLLLTFASATAQAETISKKFDGEKITKVEVQNGSGEVKISSSGNDKSMVEAEKIKVDKDCEISMEQAGTTLLIKAQRKSNVGSGECEVDFDIQVPKVVEVDLMIGSGSAKIKDTRGKFRFRAGSGTIEYNGETSAIDGAIGSGSASLVGVTGGGELRSGSGSYNLTYTQVPSGQLDIKSGSGDSKITLPAASKIKVSHLAGSGELTSAFPNSADAGFVINAKAGSGDLKITKN